MPIGDGSCTVLHGVVAVYRAVRGINITGLSVNKVAVSLPRNQEERGGNRHHGWARNGKKETGC